MTDSLVFLVKLTLSQAQTPKEDSSTNLEVEHSTDKTGPNSTESNAKDDGDQGLIPHTQSMTAAIDGLTKGVGNAVTEAVTWIEEKVDRLTTNDEGDETKGSDESDRTKQEDNGDQGLIPHTQSTTTAVSAVAQAAEDATTELSNWAEKKVDQLNADNDSGVGPYASPATCIQNDMDPISIGVLPAMEANGTMEGGSNSLGESVDTAKRSADGDDKKK